MTTFNVKEVSIALCAAVFAGVLVGMLVSGQLWYDHAYEDGFADGVASQGLNKQIEDYHRYYQANEAMLDSLSDCMEDWYENVSEETYHTYTTAKSQLKGLEQSTSVNTERGLHQQSLLFFFFSSGAKPSFAAAQAAQGRQ